MIDSAFKVVSGALGVALAVACTDDGGRGDGGGDFGDVGDESTGDGADGDEGEDDVGTDDETGGADDDDGQVDPCDAPPADMVCVRGGSFVNGASPQEERSVPDLLVDIGEVSVESFALCVDDGACQASQAHDENVDCNLGATDRGVHPINCVSWFEAEAYCAFVDKRLPTEWEWEWVARGGDEARVYPWGEELPTCERAVIDGMGGPGCGDGSTAAVASRSPAGDSRDGLHDLSGNVLEWTQSWSDDTEAARVVRGGSWTFASADIFRADHRRINAPGVFNPSIGFRCVRSLD